MKVYLIHDMATLLCMNCLTCFDIDSNVLEYSEQFIRHGINNVISQ